MTLRAMSSRPYIEVPAQGNQIIKAGWCPVSVIHSSRR